MNKFTTFKGKFTADFEHYHSNKDDLKKWFPRARIYYWYAPEKCYRLLDA